MNNIIKVFCSEVNAWTTITTAFLVNLELNKYFLIFKNDSGMKKQISLRFLKDG